jgi:CspA family cold shock protein
MSWQRDRSDSRRRGGGQRRDEFGDFGGFESAPQMRSPRPEFSRPPATVDQPNISATVKWFNGSKGFGFVSPVDGSADAFLHISVLERLGATDIGEGATIVCDLGPGQRGPQVVTIHSIDASTTAPRKTESSSSGGSSRHDYDAPQGEPGPEVEGRVKFFSADKGFGFIAVEDGGKDVFVHVRALEKAGIRSLEPDQRVRLTVSNGQKGPQADSVSLI